MVRRGWKREGLEMCEYLGKFGLEYVDFIEEKDDRGT